MINNVEVELTEQPQTTKTMSLIHNKQSYEYWKDSLVKLGYNRAKSSFLEDAKDRVRGTSQSVRLRRAAAGGRSLRGGRSSNTNSTQMLIEYDDDSLLYQFFDLTTNRQIEVFNHWDIDNDGRIGLNEFLAGLKSQNLQVDADDASTPHAIAELFGCDKAEDVEISLHEFATFLHRTKLAILFYEPLRRQVYLKIKGHGMFLKSHPTAATPPTYVPTAQLLIIDYNISDVNICCQNPTSNDPPLPFTLNHDTAKTYFFGSRDKNWTMRWLTVLKPDPISVITLAVKYRLHPLALEDMLQLNLQRPKVDKYDKHYFVVLPAIRLTSAAYDMMSEWNVHNPNLCDIWDQNKNDSPLVENQNYALCVAGPNHSEPKYSYDTVISVEAGFSSLIPINNTYRGTQKRSTSATTSAPRGERETRSYHRQATYDGGTHSHESTVDQNDQDSERSKSSFQNSMFKLLGTDFSRLRMQRSVFMMYQLIDTAITKIAPVLDMYKMRLEWYTVQIRKQRWKFGVKIRGLLDTKRELELLTDILRPCLPVIRHIINDKDIAADDEPLSETTDNEQKVTFDNNNNNNNNKNHQAQAHQIRARLFRRAEIKQYFEDIDDTLNLYIENLKHMGDLCDSYNSEFSGYGDKRMNDILFVLTIVTTLFVPAQFFTGVFGMNFLQADGTPNMPLLNWQYGYLFFWLLSLGLTFLTFLVLFINGWMPCQACNRCADTFDDDDA